MTSYFYFWSKTGQIYLLLSDRLCLPCDCARTVNAGEANGNLALNGAALEITEELAASLAVDGDVNTHSCTQDTDPQPWWAVDLGQQYSIDSVTITLPSVSGNQRNCHSLCFIH